MKVRWQDKAVKSGRWPIILGENEIETDQFSNEMFLENKK